MVLKMPNSMEECVYFTRRKLEDKGFAIAWVYREKCPKCKKGLMGKPRDEKTGKVKILAKEYVCPECGYTMEKGEYEDTLTADIQYTCPHCEYKGEHQMSFKRKKVKVFDKEEQKKKSVDALKFKCGKCGEDILITKKMK
ncbi:hypothetical protein GF358_04590 [Candidatus Woesearchaeota archaeon]|nr:hypothetical protein [Candidatus Woesearchaeota archaeon]